ncbi:MAG: hypothetical protein ISS82_05670 [Nanoarchaeota archaeon]|nr:hypothetical protein [Nanoarchaeota archaeon]
MVKCMKLIFLVIFLLFFVNIVSADINLYMSSKDIYNLNDDVELSVSVLVDEDLRGFLKSNVACDDYDMDYYIIPINLVANDIESFEIPELNLFENMLGSCKINVLLLDNNLNVVEEKSSEQFTVTDELILNAELNKVEFLPGGNLIIKGGVNYVIGQGVGEYILDIYLDDNNLESVEYDSSSFKYTLELSDKIKSNAHKLKLDVSDEYGNKGEKLIEFFVKVVPTKLKNKINQLEFLPGEEVSIESLLYDQADELMYSDVSVKVFDAKNELVLGEDGNTNDKILFTLGKYTVPGKYTVATKNKDFEIESEFSVLEVKDVNVYLEGGELFIKNEGNIGFIDEILVDLDDFSFFEDVSLDVEEVKKIILVDDVEDGEYNLTVTANNKNFNLGLVDIKDDRSIIEKVGNKLTGNIVLTNFGGVFSNGLIWIILVLIVLVGLWYYLTFKNKSNKIKEIGVSEGKKTLDKIRAGRAQKKFGVKKTNFVRREEKKDEGDKSNLFGMFD